MSNLTNLITLVTTRLQQIANLIILFKRKLNKIFYALTLHENRWINKAIGSKTHNS